MDSSQPSVLADRTDPAMSRSAVQALTVSTPQHRTFVELADRQVDGACGSGDERDGRRLGDLAHDPQGPMTPFKPKVFDVGGACFANP